MSKFTPNIILKLVLSGLALFAATALFRVMAENGGAVNARMIGQAENGGFTAFFLLIALLVMANYISNRAVPGKSHYAILWIAPIVITLYFVFVTWY